MGSHPQPETRPDLDQVVCAISSSRKYRAICADTIRRIAEQESAKRGTSQAVIKATRRRLHQVYGAFEHDLDYEAAYRRLEAAVQTGSVDEIKTVCRHILGQHSSTRERLPILERFYPTLFEITGRPELLLDLGCGLNPLALPWMGLAPPARYVALDIDADRIGFLNRCLALSGLEPLARCQDVLLHPPDDRADVALLLKMSPSLERQQSGATERLLAHLKTRFAVVSFAVKSLGGREKGMQEHYGRQFQGLAESQRWPVEKLEFVTELVYVIKLEK